MRLNSKKYRVCLLIVFAVFCFTQLISKITYDKGPSSNLLGLASWTSAANATKCSEKRKQIVFLKTHKAASSTLQNVFMRFGDTNNLFFALPRTNNYFGHPMRFNRRYVLDPEILLHHYNLSYSILTHHMRFNYRETKAVVKNAIYLTVLRDPASLFESLFVYADLGRKLLPGHPVNVTFEEFTYLMDKAINVSSMPSPLLTFPKSTIQTTLTQSNVVEVTSQEWPKLRPNKRYAGKFGRNQMIFDLGFSSYHFDQGDIVSDFIKYIDSIFNLVMITERMDESLILLKELMCWSLEDVVVFKHNPRSQEFKMSSPISEDSMNQIKRINAADVQLYRYFYDKFEKRVEDFGRDRMKEQVNQLRNMTDSFYRKCVLDEQPLNLVVSDKFNPSSKVLAMRQRSSHDDESLCTKLTTQELIYTEKLKERQDNLLNLT
ncbi:Galactosylceramide sulfotransferase [Halotydeus destructor]|nr:Galactosylceramide sulfotransferase [Halotydeus destructor]